MKAAKGVAERIIRTARDEKLTLRDHLGLPVPENRRTAARHQPTAIAAE